VHLPQKGKGVAAKAKNKKENRPAFGKKQPTRDGFLYKSARRMLAAQPASPAKIGAQKVTALFLRR
jgi:hypothetical protein